MAKKTDGNRPLQELKGQIKAGTLGRLYIFYGEEMFLLRHYLDLVKKNLLDEVTESFNFHYFNGENFDLRSFTEAVENLPMMAEHTLVQVDDVDFFKLDEAGRNQIAQTLGDIPDYCTLIFTYEIHPWKPDKTRKKLWEAVEKNAQIVEFARQEGPELQTWVGRHFASEGKKISRELCAYLIDLTDGTMTALSGEIRKICAYSEAEEIVKADIDAVTEPVLDAVVFQMTDFLGKRNYAAALGKLDQLLKMQQEPLAILGAVGNHFRRLSAARTLMDHGKGAGEMMKLCGMSSYAADKTMAAARGFSSGFCAKAASLIMETDYRIKTSFDEPERLLQDLILRLAQEGSGG